jgi:hypothetical protein
MARDTHKRGRKRTPKRGGQAAAPVMDYPAIIKAHELKMVINNPASKFVVVTYWWGRGNANKNYLRFGDDMLEKAIADGKRVNYACTGEISEGIKEDLIEEIREEEEEEQAIEKAIADGMFDEPHEFYEISKERRIAILKKYPLKYNGKKVQEILAREDVKKRLSAVTAAELKNMEAKGLVKRPAIKFEDMIAEWEAMCKRVGCNYIVEEYPEFAFPGKYQLAINLKPLFIKEALRVAGAQGRGVLYIDGDMKLSRYPDIFDMPGVDFMARGWNVDPRGNMNYLKDDVCFDPYIFETSGGTMFFAPTPQAVALLNTWSKTSSWPENAGKADDRILSMVFTYKRQHEAISSIQLPIEYLWLNDAYNFQKPEDIIKSKIMIEHPACLTSEEAAREQGAADSREPPLYEEVISDQVDCLADGGVFYEYIFFTERKFVESFEPYLKYLRRAKNNAGSPFFKVVDFDEKYGKFNKVAMDNTEKIKAIPDTTIPRRHQVVLPQDTPVPNIIAYLKKDNNVILGNYNGKYAQHIDLIAENTGGPATSFYQKGVVLDTTKPMFFASGNPVLVHLLMMCEKLEDINLHYKQSFLFTTRIRGFWTKTDGSTP